MAMLSRRLQVLLDDERFARLEREAARRGSSVATVVREAIDAAFPDDGLGLSRAEAGRILLAAESVTVGDWPAVKDEINQTYQVAD